MIVLEEIGSDGAGNRRTFRGLTRIVIGREATCDLVLRGRGVAPRHALLEAVGEAWTISDLGSVRGTHVGDRPIMAGHRLAEGDRISIGYTTLVVRRLEAGTSEPTPYRSPGRELERFRLVERIGQGDLAEVHLAEESGSGRQVALKRLLPHLADNKTFVDLFRDEAYIAAQLNHPNICRFIAAGETPGIGRYIAMELIDGVDLGQVLARAAGALKPGLAAYIIGEVCAGLEHAHLRADPDGQPLQIVHRQVTPANVMVSRAGEVKLIDFSTARARGRRSVTEPGVIKGHLGYMAPETIMGLAVDHRADIFAAGALLYELLVGRRAFEGASDFGTLQAVRAAQVTPPREVNRKVSELLEVVVLRALAREPEERYQSAAELLWDLAEAIPSGKRLERDQAAEVINRFAPDRR